MGGFNSQPLHAAPVPGRFDTQHLARPGAPNQYDTQHLGLTPGLRKLPLGQPSNPSSDPFGWLWSGDLTAYLPEAVKTLYAEGVKGLEARLVQTFQGLSPQQEVNIERKLLAALEREKDAAVAREDYLQASHYKYEIDALRNQQQQHTRAQSFARAASFMAQAHSECKGKGKGKGKGLGKGKDFGKGKDCLLEHYDQLNDVMMMKGGCKGPGKGKHGEGYDKGMGKGYEDVAKGGGKGKDDGDDYMRREVNGSFARRERAMAQAVDPSYCSFATDGAQGGSFSSHAPPSLALQKDAFGGDGSCAVPRQDASFAAGLPRSAAGAGQPQFPVCASFPSPTHRDSSSTLPAPHSSSMVDDFSMSAGCAQLKQVPSKASFNGAAMGPSAPRQLVSTSTSFNSPGCKTCQPPASFQTIVPSGGSFAMATKTMYGQRSHGLAPIQEL